MSSKEKIKEIKYEEKYDVIEYLGSVFHYISYAIYKKVLSSIQNPNIDKEISEDLIKNLVPAIDVNIKLEALTREDPMIRGEVHIDLVVGGVKYAPTIVDLSNLMYYEDDERLQKIIDCIEKQKNSV